MSDRRFFCSQKSNVKVKTERTQNIFPSFLIMENSHSHFIENFNRQFRKETKSKAVFPNDDALLKVLYLAQIDITKKWSGRHRDRGEIHSQLEVFFADRLPKQQKSRFISRIK